MLRKNIKRLLILGIILIIANGCASKNHEKISITDEGRLTEKQIKHMFVVSEPTIKKPVITFKLIQLKTYDVQKKQVTKTIQKTQPDGLGGLIALPFVLAGSILSFGELDVYKALKSEKVVRENSKWVNSGSKKEQTAVSGAPVNFSYKYLGEPKGKTINTDTEGQILKDLRQLAKSISDDHNPPEFIQFSVSIPTIDKNSYATIKIPYELFIKIYNKWKGEGYYQS